MAQDPTNPLSRLDDEKSSHKIRPTSKWSYKTKMRELGSTSVDSCLSICVDHPPDHVFTAGETVTGYVVTRVAPARNESIIVRLSGRTKAKIEENRGQSSITYRARALLFDFPWKEPQPEVRGDSTVWPFSISFPTDLESVHGPYANGKIKPQDYWQRTWRPKPPFINDHKQPLPPNCYEYAKDRIAIGESYVSYAVTASLTPYGKSKATAECMRLLNFQPWSTRSPETPLVMWPTNRTIEAKTWFLLPEYEGRSLTLKELSSSLFNSDRVPSIRFDVEMTIPLEISLGEAITTKLHFSAKAIHGSISVLPDITLMNTSITIRAYTSSRCPKRSKRDYKKESSRVVYSRARTIPVTLTKQNDYTVESLTPPALGFAPTFATYNIVRTYRIKVEWHVRIKDKTFKIDRAAHVQVYPCRYAPGVESLQKRIAIRSTHDVPGPSNCDGTAELSQYASPEDWAPPMYDEAVNNNENS
ncbi:MAG: hypothetical protein M1828_004073 [Chrysothrix sp. TS-e1954]|nr:MAG: hypothetical protein M1828_004073 [Chrysothrix sp. TS-e1954]